MDDRPSLFDDQPALSDHLTDDVVSYRSVSPLAVLGAVLGITSPLALVSAFLAPLAMVGAVVSLVAISSIRRDPESKSGQWVATFGLFLSLLVLGATLLRGPLVQRLHSAAAEPLVERYLDLLSEGDFAAAHQLTLPYSKRRPGEEAMRVHYGVNAEAQADLEAFQSQDIIQRISAQDPQLVGQSNAERTGPGVVSITWLYRLPATEGRPELGLKVRTERKRLGERSSWRIAQTEVARAPS